MYFGVQRTWNELIEVLHPTPPLFSSNPNLLLPFKQGGGFQIIGSIVEKVCVCVRELGGGGDKSLGAKGRLNLSRESTRC